jgi:hypothetical protein
VTITKEQLEERGLVFEVVTEDFEQEDRTVFSAKGDLDGNGYVGVVGRLEHILNSFDPDFSPPPPPPPPPMQVVVVPEQ